MEAAPHAPRRRKTGLTVAGLLLTLAIHAAIVGVVAWNQRGSQAPVVMPRDFMVAKIVRLGRKRPKELLPTLPSPPPPPTAPKEAIKVTDNENAKPVPKTDKPPPNAKPGDLKNALAKVQQMGKLERMAEQEGDPEGSPSGNSDTAGEGDPYLASVQRIYYEEWKKPSFALGQGLESVGYVFIDAQGNVFKTSMTKRSGNGPYDSTVLEVLAKVKKVPPPPAERTRKYERSGIPITFALE